MALHKRQYLLSYPPDLALRIFDLLHDALISRRRSPHIFSCEGDPLKMQRAEYRVHLAHIGVGDKVASVHMAVAPDPFQEHCVQILKEIPFQLAVIIYAYPPEADLHILILHDFLDIYVQRAERLQHVGPLF